ncbi:MAG TPA: gamma-glutamylcyclotransferase family protein [Gemmatimonadaceae bacterium]|nr:gamma-glutamylcyclotransferase family protein [Gemmatimonadaceae bacterium]
MTDVMPSTDRVSVFFYGLFMDADLLRAKGLRPEEVQRAHVSGYSLRIGERATLVNDETGQVHGIVMSLTQDELDRLYAEPSVQAYRPQHVVAHLAGGDTIAALCYNLAQPPSPGERNPDYAAKLRKVAEKVGLPNEYIVTLQ